MIGVALQATGLDPNLNAWEHMDLQTALQGIPKTQRKQRAGELLERVGLTEAADRPAGGYSGGMKRRLDLALALVHQPRVLFLDEPTTGLDPQARRNLWDVIAGFRSEGRTVILTTHYMEEAQRLCDRIGILDEGKLIAEGTRLELVSLMGGRDRVRLSADGDVAPLADALSGVDGVEQVTTGDGGVELTVKGARRALPRIFAAVNAAGAAMTGVEVVEPDLEAVFLHLTGKALRD